MKINKQLIFLFMLLSYCLMVAANAQSRLTPHVSYLIVPGIRVGAISPNSNEKELVKIYGKDKVRSARIYIGEGEYKSGTIIFSDDLRRRLEIIWKDEQRKRLPELILISGEKSLWRTRQGISLGTRLKQLERINGKPFVLAGFSWDYAGTIMSWEDGKLKQLFEAKKKRAMILRLSEETNHKLPEAELGTVDGDRDFSSSNEIMQKINPKVYQMIIEFP